MKRLRLAQITSIGIAGALAVAFNACGKTSLAGLDQVVQSSVVPTQVKVNFCTTPATVPQQNLKMVVVLDHSGSNQYNYQFGSDGGPLVQNGQVTASTALATDPTGQLRYGTVNTPGTLLNFLYQQSTNAPTDATQRFYALVDFNSSVDAYPTGAKGFTSDIGGFYQEVLTRSQAGTPAGGTPVKPADTGATDYLAALQAVNSIITSDIAAATACAAKAQTAAPTATCPAPGVVVPSSYVVVFMSDGAPVLSIDGIGQTANGQIVVTGPVVTHSESTVDILGQVSTLASLTANPKFVSSVNFFTIYYYYPGNVDVNGQKLLQQMAQVGNGIAYDQRSGDSIDYTKFQPPVKRIKPTLSDVFVTNASATWWGSQFLADTDMDGLPDQVETQWGSNPNQRSSYNNGVSDFVQYQVAAGGARANVNYRTGVCNGIKSSTVAGRLTFNSSDLNGLNDCEKVVLQNTAGIGIADSNGDLIPDFLEFKNLLPFQAGTAPAINVRDQDGFTIYQKIKYGLPVNVSTAQLMTPMPASYDLQQVSTNDTQDCYALTVTGVPTVTSQDVVRVDVIEKSELLQQNLIYHRGLKSFGGQKNLVINDWTDPTESVTWGPQ